LHGRTPLVFTETKSDGDGNSDAKGEYGKSDNFFAQGFSPMKLRLLYWEA
ncbi:MAG: hypothetical protein H7Y09_06040, partial [Chitinophagaceae bacterium]|nr:hypothetical protein [Anaerolineae bacterium]